MATSAAYRYDDRAGYPRSGGSSYRSGSFYRAGSNYRSNFSSSYSSGYRSAAAAGRAYAAADYGYAYGGSAQRAARPIPEQPRPHVKVVRGGKPQAEPGISGGAVLALRIVAVALVCFMVFGFVRVALSSASYEIASQATQVRSELSDARSEASDLAVEKSSIANPTTLRQKATEELGMSAPTEVETLTLPVDVVVTDSAGNLSLSGSLAQVAAIG